jgi:hypothetical protein
MPTIGEEKRRQQLPSCAPFCIKSMLRLRAESGKILPVWDLARLLQWQRKCTARAELYGPCLRVVNSSPWIEENYGNSIR